MAIGRHTPIGFLVVGGFYYKSDNVLDTYTLFHFLLLLIIAILPASAILKDAYLHMRELMTRDAALHLAEGVNTHIQNTLKTPLTHSKQESDTPRHITALRKRLLYPNSNICIEASIFPHRGPYAVRTLSAGPCQTTNMAGSW